MNAREAILALLDELESPSSNYVLVGAFATAVWGIPRATANADFVVAMSGT